MSAAGRSSMRQRRSFPVLPLRLNSYSENPGVYTEFPAGFGVAGKHQAAPFCSCVISPRVPDRDRPHYGYTCCSSSTRIVPAGAATASCWGGGSCCGAPKGGEQFGGARG